MGKALLSDSYDSLEHAALRVLSVINTVTLGKDVVELSNLLTYSFNKIKTILNVPQSTGLDSSPEICERFLRFFTDKLVATGACISQPSYDPSIPSYEALWFPNRCHSPSLVVNSVS